MYDPNEALFLTTGLLFLMVITAVVAIRGLDGVSRPNGDFKDRGRIAVIVSGVVGGWLFTTAVWAYAIYIIWK